MAGWWLIENIAEWLEWRDRVGMQDQRMQGDATVMQSEEQAV
jgi:hypothetical protein